jgi:hypothetical protein
MARLRLSVLPCSGSTTAGRWDAERSPHSGRPTGASFCGPVSLLPWLTDAMNAGGPDSLQCSVLGESGAVTDERVSQGHSQSYIATDGQSLCLSWCWAPSGTRDQIFVTLWELLSCPWGGGALSDERTGRSFVSQSIVLRQMSQCTTVYISHVIKYIHNIHNASVSPGSVQQIMPYIW